MNAFAFKIMAISLSLVLALAANASAEDKQSEPPETITITTTIPASSTNAIPVTVCAGLQFSITLQANPTTGYIWRLGKQLDENIITLKGSKYSKAENNLIGAGGTEVWTFQAVNKGITQIVLEYARPWEKDVAPIKTQTFAVTVQ